MAGFNAQLSVNVAGGYRGLRGSHTEGDEFKTVTLSDLGAEPNRRVAQWSRSTCAMTGLRR